MHVGPARSLAELVDSLRAGHTGFWLPGRRSRRAYGTETRDSLAYDYYLLAQHHCNRFTEADLRRSLAYSDSAIVRDPAYANAWLGRANALLALASGMGSITGREALGPIRQAVDTVLVLDPGSGRAHAIRGMVYTWFEWDWDAADREFRRRSPSSPRSATNYQRAAFLQAAEGHADSALALGLCSAIRAGQHPGVYGPGSRSTAGVTSEPRHRAERALQLDPYFFGALQYEALALSALGRHAEAVAVARRRRYKTGSGFRLDPCDRAGRGR